MQRDILLLTEMTGAAEQAQRFVHGVTVSQLEADRQRRDALLRNFTVLGEAAARSRPLRKRAMCCGLRKVIDGVPTGFDLVLVPRSFLEGSGGVQG